MGHASFFGHHELVAAVAAIAALLLLQYLLLVPNTVARSDVLLLIKRAVQYASAGGSSSRTHQHEVHDCEKWLLGLYSDLLKPAQDDPQGELLLHLSKGMAVLQLLQLPLDQRGISEDSIKKLRRQRRVRHHSVVSYPRRTGSPPFFCFILLPVRHALPQQPFSAPSSVAVQLLWKVQLTRRGCRTHP